MKSKWLFALLLVLVFGALISIGVFFYEQNARLIWIIEGVALSGILLSVLLYYKLIKPYQVILSGMELLKEQDFSTMLRKGESKEANQMIDVFNRMISQLRHERLQVREKNHFMDLLIKASPLGIIILDYDFRVTDVNPFGLKLLGIDHIDVARGKTLAEMDIELASLLATLNQGDDIVIRNMGTASYRCVRSSFVDQGFDHPFILIEEITHELLKVEKESYDRIIRMMSHEVNNSVGAIGSTLNVVSDILNQEDMNHYKDVLPAIDASFNRCGHLAQFISNLAQVVRIPPPSLSYVSLNEQAKAIEALTRMECTRRNIKLTMQLDERDCLVHIDGIQFEQALFNIVKNAYESIDTNGEIRIITNSSPASVLVEDNGPGIPPDVDKKLFTPFYTTKTTGQGIGLMFVRDILVNHNCKFNLNTKNGWTTFQIYFTK